MRENDQIRRKNEREASLLNYMFSKKIIITIFKISPVSFKKIGSGK